MPSIVDDFINLKYICTQVDFPFCRVLSDVPCEFMGRTSKFGPIVFFSPTTLIALVLIILSILRIVKVVKSKYSGIGRKEFIIFLYLYMATITLDLILISNLLMEVLPDATYKILLSVQLGFVMTSIWSLFIGSILTYTFYKGSVITSLLLVKMSSIFYYIGCVTAMYIFLTLRLKIAFFAVLFVYNGVLLFLYFILQIGLLMQIDAEVWGYGTLFVGLIFFLGGITPIFYGSNIIALLSERYLDGLFFFHLFTFCSIIMIHKFWLSVYDDEAECTAILYEDTEDEDIKSSAKRK